jgi:hypothetical protein
VNSLMSFPNRNVVYKSLVRKSDVNTSCQAYGSASMTCDHPEHYLESLIVHVCLIYQWIPLRIGTVSN